MPKVTLTEHKATMKDPFLTDNWELSFNLPAFISGGDEAAMRILAKSAAKPGSTIEQILSEAFAHADRHAGRKTFSGQMPVNYGENRELIISKTLEDWHNGIRDTETQLGAFKEDYAVDADLRLFKQDGTITAEYKIIGFWPTEVPEVQLDQSGQAAEVSAQFSFDYFTRK